MKTIIYNEVYEIIKNMDYIYLNKIPDNYIKFIKSNMIPNKTIEIDTTKPLNKQNFHQETFDIIAEINLKYWTNNEKTKNLLINKYSQNEKE